MSQDRVRPPAGVHSFGDCGGYRRELFGADDVMKGRLRAAPMEE